MKKNGNDSATKESKPGKKSHKPELTPEFIARQIAVREARKSAKLEARAKAEAEKGGTGDNEVTLSESFIRRPLLDLPRLRDGYSNGVRFKIMTYNVLAQNLIRRDLFPQNGDALKWKWRSKALAAEISYYNPDIVCMQEVDSDKFEPFWKPLLADLKLEATFTTYPGKAHGQIIAYKSHIFSKIDEKLILYDEEITNGAENQALTKNTGMLLALRMSKEHEQVPQHGVIVGTTHMFWHPKGSYERARQLAIFIEQAQNFAENYKGWPILLGGDYNSEPFDLPYILVTEKPQDFDSEAHQLALESLAHKFKGHTDDPVSESQTISSNTLDAINALLYHHRKSTSIVKSLYGQGYSLVHPENTHPKNKNEPYFSNWAHAWRGLLDYIFVLNPLADRPPLPGEIVCGLRLLQLLRLPTPEEMGPEPSGQPRQGQYPSDHLCLMATVEVDGMPA